MALFGLLHLVYGIPADLPHFFSLKGVLEKNVESEAEALSKAKTLYKSCTNDSEWATNRYPSYFVFLFWPLSSAIRKNHCHKLSLNFFINKDIKE